MFAGFGGFNNQTRVGIGAGTDDNGVNGRVVEQCPMIPMGGRNAKSGGTLLGTFQEEIGDGQDLGVGNAIDALSVDAANAAGPNEAKVEFIRHGTFTSDCDQPSKSCSASWIQQFYLRDFYMGYRFVLIR
jgi:hypothetical protein